MATYKVIQDIEAEDKLLGPLTLRQFIYAAVVAVMGFIAYKLFPISPLLILPFLPPMVFFGMLAAPFGHDQPSEVWMLARIRFFLIPRRRIWNQDGTKELVSITAPKKPEHKLTNGLNQYEVKSRLSALASTLDSRGWAIKNAAVNSFSEPSYLTGTEADSDRLISASNLPQDVPAYDVSAADDIMDEQSNPTAQHLDSMIDQSDQVHRQALVASMQQSANSDAQAAQPPADYWFMNQPSQPPATAPGYATFSSNPMIFPGTDDATTSAQPTEDEEKLLEKIHTERAHEQSSHGHLKTVQPLSADDSQLPSQPPISNNDDATASAAQPADDQPVNPAILRLADNDDLNVATIAREAQKASEPEPLNGEVTISLR